MGVLASKANVVVSSVQGELGSTALPSGFLAIILQLLTSLLSGGLGGGCLTPTPTPIPPASLAGTISSWSPRVRYGVRQGIRDAGLNDYEPQLMRAIQAQAVSTTADEVQTASAEIVSWMA